MRIQKSLLVGILGLAVISGAAHAEEGYEDTPMRSEGRTSKLKPRRLKDQPQTPQERARYEEENSKVYESPVSRSYSAPKSSQAPQSESVGRVSVITESMDWKGEPPAERLRIGAVAGLGIADPVSGFALIPHASTVVAEHGFIDDLNDQTSLELELGPMFLDGGSALFYSAHMRWDFHRNLNWTFFAMGGLGGFFSSDVLGDFRIFPRFGAGFFFHFANNISLRTEVSHEVLGVGISFGF